MELRAASWDDLAPVAARLGQEPETIRSEWELPGFDHGRDSWVAERDGRLAGYAALTASQRLLIAADDDAADDLLARAVARGRERGLDAIRVVARADDPVVRRHPFELENETLVMWRSLDGPLPEPRLPPGITVRTFEREDAEAVHALLDGAYGAWDRHYVPQAHGSWLRFMTGDVEFDPSVWWLAEREGELVGCALHWSSGWLKDLAVRDAERSRGLGRALVVVGLREFVRRGAGRVGLKVDAANPTGAIRLYEALGFVTESREATWVLTL